MNAIKKLCTWLILAAIFLTGCSGKQASTSPGDAVLSPVPVEYDTEAPMFCEAESEEEAQQIAELYGITLVRYSYKVASFYTDKDPEELIRLGEKNGWPKLELNQLGNYS